MKNTLLVLSILTGILIFSTLVCGLWLRYTSDPVEDSSRTFHMVIALTTVAFATLTIMLAVREVYSLSA